MLRIYIVSVFGIYLSLVAAERQTFCRRLLISILHITLSLSLSMHFVCLFLFLAFVDRSFIVHNCHSPLSASVFVILTATINTVSCVTNDHHSTRIIHLSPSLSCLCPGSSLPRWIQKPLVVRDRDGRPPRGPSGSALLLCV